MTDLVQVCGMQWFEGMSRLCKRDKCQITQQQISWGLWCDRASRLKSDVRFQVFLVELRLIVYKISYLVLILLCNNILQPEFCTVTWSGLRLLNVKIILSLNRSSRSTFYLFCASKMLPSTNAVFSRDIVATLGSCISRCQSPQLSVPIFPEYIPGVSCLRSLFSVADHWVHKYHGSESSASLRIPN